MFGTENLRSLHLLDPETRPLLDAIPPFRANFDRRESRVIPKRLIL